MVTASATAEDSLRQNGKTFHWARRFLGDDMGHGAATLYSFCRILDDMADGDIPDGPKRLKSVYDDLTSGRVIKDADLASFSPFIANHHLSPDVVLALIDGLLMDQSEVALKTDNDVIRYGYHVAGTVGILMCSILNADLNQNDRAYYHAIDMGIGMQLTNIARDVLEDAHMGRRYLPAEWVGGMSADDITATAMNSDKEGIACIRSGIQRLLSLAERYYNSGISGLNYLPIRAHLAILIAGKSYRQIGIQLARQGTNWHHGRTVTSTATKVITSLSAMPLMAGRRGQPSDHDSRLHEALKGLPHVHSG